MLDDIILQLKDIKNIFISLNLNCISSQKILTKFKILRMNPKKISVKILMWIEFAYFVYSYILKFLRVTFI